MARIRPTGTKPELLVFRFLRSEGIYFQKHYKGAVGRPDVAWPRKKLAVFIDGDFWHGYRFKEWKHKLPQGYWQAKIEANIKRDKRTFSSLRKNGWRVMRIWEHDLASKKRDKTFRKLLMFLDQSR